MNIMITCLCGWGIVLLFIGNCQYAVGVDRGTRGIQVSVSDNVLFGQWPLRSRWNGSLYYGIFDIHEIDYTKSSAKYFRLHIDVAVIDKPISQSQIWLQNGMKKPLSFVVADNQHLSIWDNKLTFKHWLIDNGFSDHVLPAQTKTTSFPCILKVVDLYPGKKDHVTSGINVFLIKNATQLSDVVSLMITNHNIKVKEDRKKNYFIEEALPGLYEGTFYAAAFEGELVSLRCMMRQSYGDGSPGHVIYGVKEKRFKIDHLPCGTIIRDQAKKMAMLTSFSGLFCVNFKFREGSFHHYFMENNPRICGTVVRSPHIFLANFLALAFAVQKKNCFYYNICRPWYTDSKSILHWLTYVEKLVVLTGDVPSAAVTWDKSENKSWDKFIDFNPTKPANISSFFVSKILQPLSTEDIAKKYRKYRKKHGETVIYYSPEKAKGITV